MLKSGFCESGGRSESEEVEREREGERRPAAAKKLKFELYS